MGEFEEAFRRDLAERRLPSWSRPFHWWGPTWAEPVRRSLADLIGERVVDAPTATRLAERVRGGGSVVVAAAPSRVGKSTLADALTAELATGLERVYVRGSYETFDFVESVDVARSALLVNELSPHLPIYLWGEAARRVLAMARDGAQLIGTMHADSPEEVVYQLARRPVGASPEEIAALGMVVFLTRPARDHAARWEVGRVVRFSATGQGVRVEEVAVSDGEGVASRVGVWP